MTRQGWNKAWAVASFLCVMGSSVIAGAQVAVTQHNERVLAEQFQADVTTFNVSLGATVNTGNTEAWQVATGSKLDLIRGRHGLGMVMAFAYGRANLANDAVDSMVDTVRNFNTRVRYDFFLTPMDALFAAGVYRWDTFTGLDLRAQGQLGYMRNFYKVEKHRLWGEAGYDLTYDNYDPDPLVAASGERLEGDDVVHSARLFFGYDNQLNEAITFLTGVEGLLNVEEPDDLRVLWDSALRSALMEKLQLEVKFTLIADTVPVPGAKGVDTRTMINLIYTLM